MSTCEEATTSAGGRDEIANKRQSALLQALDAWYRAKESFRSLGERYQIDRKLLAAGAYNKRRVDFEHGAKGHGGRIRLLTDAGEYALLHHFIATRITEDHKYPSPGEICSKARAIYVAEQQKMGNNVENDFLSEHFTHRWWEC